jgi:hypothetical protein
MKRFILVRQNRPKTGYCDVVIHDTSETIPAVINGFPSRIYKPISEVMNYLEAYPIAKRLNDEHQNSQR